MPRTHSHVLGIFYVMPQMGYGVYQVDPKECERCVLDAIKTLDLKHISLLLAL